MEKRYNQGILSNYLAFITAFIPLVIWPYAKERFFMPKMLMLYACAVLLLVLIAALNLNIFSKKLFKETITYSALFFIIYTTITLFYSINLELSLTGLYERRESYFLLLIYILLLLTAANNYIYKTSHFILFTVMISIICIYAIVQLTGVELLDLLPNLRYKIVESWHYRAFSTLGNPNFLASMMVLALPITTYAFIYKKNLLLALPMSLNYFVLLATRTRGGWIAAFIGFVILAVFLWKAHLKYIIIACAIFAVLTVVYALLYEGFVHRLLSIFKTTLDVIAPDDFDSFVQSGSNRVGIWAAVWTLIKQRPWTGYGVETLRQAINENEQVVQFLSSMDIKLLTADKAHNEFLNIAVSSGLPAAISYLVLNVAAIIKGFKNVNKHYIMLPVTLSVLTYFIQGMFNISTTGIAFIHYVLIGVILSVSLRGGGQLIEANELKEIGEIYE